MDRYLNFDAVILENENLRLAILPDLGFKIASIYEKNKEMEFLFQPTDRQYKKAVYGADFSHYDTSGIDDCIPTIDVCKYPFDDSITLPDHGDVWSLEWELLESSESHAKGGVKLPSLPLYFTKNIELEGTRVKISYEAKNLSSDEVSYLWAFHGLSNYDEDTVLEFEEGLKNYINVQNDEVWDFNIFELKNFKKDHTFKYYFTDEIKEGKAVIDHTKKRVRYSLSFDPKALPYMGVWLTTGGFKGERNVAIEPCNGYYDSLEKAYKNEKYKTVAGHATDKWAIDIEITNY